MNKLILTLSALPAALSLSLIAPGAATDALARHHYHHYYNTSHARTCRHSDGTTGLVAGGVGGALLGSKVIGGGLLGTVAGGVGGAFAGRAIDRTITAKKRCS